MCDDAALKKTLGFYLKSRSFLPALLLDLFFTLHWCKKYDSVKVNLPQSKKGTSLDAVSH